MSNFFVKVLKKVSTPIDLLKEKQYVRQTICKEPGCAIVHVICSL